MQKCSLIFDDENPFGREATQEEINYQNHLDNYISVIQVRKYKIKFLKKHDPWMKDLFGSQKIIDIDLIDDGTPEHEGIYECKFDVISYPAAPPDWESSYEIILKNVVKRC